MKVDELELVVKRKTGWNLQENIKEPLESSCDPSESPLGPP